MRAQLKKLVIRGFWLSSLRHVQKQSQTLESEQQRIVTSVLVILGLVEAPCLQRISPLPALVLATRETFVFGFQETLSFSF